MTREDALNILSAKGILGPDAETSLNAALKGFASIDEMLAEAKTMSVDGVLRWFGQDGARVLLALGA